MYENIMTKTSTRLLIIGAILAITGIIDAFFGPLIDARGFSLLGIIIIIVGLLIKRND